MPLWLVCWLSDTVEERNHLLSHVFPKLKDYCRARYGIEFHALDMRWGIPIEVRHTVTWQPADVAFCYVGLFNKDCKVIKDRALAMTQNSFKYCRR